MICPQCGFFSEKDEPICPECGALIPQGRITAQTGAEAIRQGRRAKEAVLRPPEKRTSQNGAESTPEGRIPERHSYRRRAGRSPVFADPVVETEISETDSTSFDRGYRSVYSDEGESGSGSRHADLPDVSYSGMARVNHRINWMKIGFICVALFALTLLGGWLFLTRTDTGQRVMARMGRDANSAALWAVGDEQLNRGNIDGAILSFEKARAQDQNAGNVDVDGLLLLGSAYEAAGRVEDAAKLYEQIYTETPSRTEAYINHIRILRASNQPGDLAHAGELMKLAYEKTGDSSFMTQRSDLLPAPPEVDLTAGYYETKKYIAITSYEGYDVYYTFDENAELPAGGTLVNQRVFLDEGTHYLRAVAVNGELVSDELRGTYKIIMPSPQTPQSTLAPNTYKNRQRVRLKPGKENLNDADIVIYYTIDGSPPDADSPIYNGEAIMLPTGWVTLRAVAVNRYNKVSNALEVKYKIDAKPFPLSAWKPDEGISGMYLAQTTMVEFQQAFGEGTSYETLSIDGYETECRKYQYHWGYAVMNKARTGWVLVELYLTDSSVLKLPRGTAIGDTESFVVGKFRDMGQVESASGNRGLYGLDEGSGKIWLQEDDSKIIRYRATTADSHWQQLEYYVNKAGTVYAVDWVYEP